MPSDRHGAAWTREEHILAFRLYCRMPFGRLHHRAPEIMELARMLGRTASSVAMKLSNFASMDPDLHERGIKGLAGAGVAVKRIWDEFAQSPEALVLESDKLLADRLDSRLEDVAEIETRDLPPPGIEREALVRQRVNQSFFRRRVLAAYDNRCCVTGMAVRELLVASYIAPWSKDAANRLNPRNGLCLNAMHDRAFDRNLMWIDRDFVVRFSPRLARPKKDPVEWWSWMLSYEGRPLLLSGGFSPDPGLLSAHARKCKELAA